MKTRMFRLLLGVAVLALAQIACSTVTGTKATPTIPAAVPEVEATAAPDSAPASACPALKLAKPQPSGLVDGVTMARDAQGDNKEPVDPTSVFEPASIFHAVVAIKDAPADTAIRVVWYANDTNGAAECNTMIKEYELTSDGTRNIDFTLAPDTNWPAGTYRAEILINGTLDSIANFKVK